MTTTRNPIIVDPAIRSAGSRRPGINHIGRRWLLRAPDGTRELGQRIEPGDSGWYRIRNEAPDERARIDLFDEIGWDVTAGEFIAELNAINAPAIDLHVNSPGGSAWDGFAIYNSLVAHPAPVTVHVIGVAASAASIVAMAGDEVVAYRPSQMMIHRAGSGACVFGNADDMRAGAAEVQNMATSLDQIDNQIVDLYATKAGTDPQVWHDYVWAETWFDPDTALAAGLVDRIAGDEQDSPAPGVDGVSNSAGTHRDRRSHIIRARARQLHLEGSNA
jgi:ATP-dependent protease ClpP protease subunit